MAGTQFVVCVPTKEYEAELMGKEPKQNRLQSANSFSDLQKCPENLELRQSTRSKSEESLFTTGGVSGQDAQPQQNGGGGGRREMFIGPWRVDATDLPALTPHRGPRSPGISPGRSPRSPLVDTANMSRSEPEGLSGQNAKAFETPYNLKKKRHRFLEMELEKVLKELNVKNAVWCRGRKNHFFQVLFSMESGAPCEEALKKLADKGIGVLLNSVVSVLPCVLYYQGSEKSGAGSMEDVHNTDCTKKEDENYSSTGGPGCGGNRARNEQGTWERFVQSVRARLTVAQVVEGVQANACFTFDFLLLLIVASSTAALGLLEDSTVILVASMLISPLMGPVMAATFGTMICDTHLKRMGLVNECAGLLLGLLIGFLTGLGVGFLDKPWLTEEMLDRGQLRSLWVNVFIAVLSGAGIAIALLRDNTGSLVGVAISASLLPPAVNAGLLWAMSLVYAILSPSYPQDLKGNEVFPHYTSFYSDRPEVEMAIMGGISLCITFINIVFIYLTGILMLKVKEVAPNTQAHQRFWKHDVKIARDYNATLYGASAAEILRTVVNHGPCNAGVDDHGEDIGASSLSKLLHLSAGLPSHFGQGGFGAEPHSLDVCPHHQLTWSPNTLGDIANANTVELEDLYLTMQQHVHQQMQHLHDKDKARRFSLNSGVATGYLNSWRLGSSDGYRCLSAKAQQASAQPACRGASRCCQPSASAWPSSRKLRTPPYENMPCSKPLRSVSTPPFSEAAPASVFRTPFNQAPLSLGDASATPIAIFLTPSDEKALTSSTVVSLDDETVAAAPRQAKKRRFVVTKADDKEMLLPKGEP